MQILLDVLFAVIGKSVVLLPVSYVIRLWIEKLVGFKATLKSTYIGLFVGNVVASIVIPMMLWTGVLTPHGNDPSRIFNQMLVHFAAHFAMQTVSLRSLCKDTGGNRLSTLHALLIALILTIILGAITALIWMTAI